MSITLVVIWKFRLKSNLQGHTNSCEFLKIPCVHPECGMLVKKADLPEHLENECMYRLVECRLCLTQIAFIRMTVLYQMLLQVFSVRQLVCWLSHKACSLYISLEYFKYIQLSVGKA